MSKVLVTATEDSFINIFLQPYLKYFKENGFTIDVASKGDEKIPHISNKHNIPFERSPFKINNIKAFLKLRKLIKKGNYDLIYTHTPVGSVITRFANIFARSKNKPKVIYTAHGFHFFKNAKKLYWIIFFPIEWLLSFFTDTIIVMNSEDYNRAKKYFKKTQIKYVNGIGIPREKFDFNLSDVEKKVYRSSMGLNEDDFLIIYIAEVSVRKNQEWLINSISEVIKKDRSIHLLLAGKDSLNGKCQKLAEDLNVDDNIHFLGFRTDVPCLLKISDLSVSTSTQEGLPTHVMESLNNRLPVVALKCRGIIDLIDDKVNGDLVNQGDKERFNSLIQNRSFTKNKNPLDEKYLLENVIKENERIFTDILSEVVNIPRIQAEEIITDIELPDSGIVYDNYK